MQTHHFDRDSGEYLYSLPAKVDPLETQAALCRGPMAPSVVLVPAHATLVAPPDALAGFGRVFVGGAWQTVADHRGERWFYADGREAIIRQLGDPAAFGLLRSPPNFAVSRRSLLRGALAALRAA